MDNSSYKINLQAIIKLEDRISQCCRCPKVMICNSKPYRGKGDLMPEVMMIFETDSVYTEDSNWVLNLHNQVKKQFGIRRVYHTFLVRCQPKSCIWLQGSNCYLTGRVLDRNGLCLLNHRLCDGIPVTPNDEIVINCLAYTVEEIAILQPRYLLLFGERVGDFILKAYGIFDDTGDKTVFQAGTMQIISLNKENNIDEKDIAESAARMRVF